MKSDAILSPAVQHWLRRFKVPESVWTSWQGSGPKGRLLKGDVLRLAKTSSSTKSTLNLNQRRFLPATWIFRGDLKSAKSLESDLKLISILGSSAKSVPIQNARKSLGALESLLM